MAPAPTNGTPLPPDLRPDAERMAEIDGAHQRNLDFARRFIASGCDPRSLPLRAISHLDGLPPQGLDEAIAKADLIVTGRIKGTRFALDDSPNPFPSAESMLMVDLVLKGAAPALITLAQAGGPVPSNDGGAIGHFAGDPVLLPGDEVIVLAMKRSDSDAYFALYPIGKYYVREGVVHTPDGNPCDSIDGLAEADVLQLIRASLQRPLSPAFPLRCNWARF